MPRLKPKGEKKMLKLQSLSELSKVVDVPDAAFPPAAAPEVPAGAFDDTAKKRKGEYPAYVKYSHNKTSGGSYAAFVFMLSTLKKHFKNVQKTDRFELVQGKAPHKEWFMLRKAILKRGNKIVSAGAVFHTTEYFKVDKMDKKEHYPLEVVAKDGVVYVKLPPELVQLLR